MKKSFALLFILLISIICKGQKANDYLVLNLDSIFGKNPGTFVLYDYQADKYQVYNYERAKTEYAVHSTSKIFWSVIGLEEGLIKNGEESVCWDSIKYPRQVWWPNSWAKNQTVVTAINKSVNWYYYELLSFMTPEMIEKYLNKLDYKKDFKVGGVHYHGLTYNIKKSALEQIDFLKRLYTNDLKISDKTLALVKQGMLFQNADQYAMYAKTGMGPIENDKGIGWFIGYIEKGNEVYFFALNVEDEDEGKAASRRIDYSMRIFSTLGLL